MDFLAVGPARASSEAGTKAAEKDGGLHVQAPMSHRRRVRGASISHREAGGVVRVRRSRSAYGCYLDITPFSIYPHRAICRCKRLHLTERTLDFLDFLDFWLSRPEIWFDCVVSSQLCDSALPPFA